jgi:hypothetical protein
MSSQQADPPIIVSGGSVSIRLPLGIFTGLLGGEVFTNSQKQIKRVTITGDDIPNYDESASGSDITITIEYGNPNP